MKEFKNFDELSNDTLKKILSFGITSKTVIEATKFCFKHLRVLMDNQDTVFSKNLADYWLNTICISYSKSTFQTSKRTINLLDDNFNGNLKKWKVYSTKIPICPTNEDYIQLLVEYENHLKQCDCKKTTVAFKVYCAKVFLYYLETMHIDRIDEINHQILSAYFLSEHFQNRKPSGVSAEMLRMNHFIKYLEEYHGINSSLHSVYSALAVNQVKIVTTVDQNIQNVILGDFPNSPSNLRNKAIFLLALRCGLRKTDIFNLRFRNIDWANRLISIVQIKTSVALLIPLEREVSNAIIDYILNERANVPSDYVFLTSLPPFRKLKSSISFKNCLKSLPLEEYPAECGLHILRRTFASHLLKAGNELSVISSALGHIDKERVNKYLSTDDEHMKLCALEITDFPYQGGYLK